MAYAVGSWEVELHGSLRGGLWKRFDCELDKVQYSIFMEGNVRSWMNGKTQTFLPGIKEDVFYVFSHILQHFFKGGIGLRQICDWCRLMWTYRDKIDIPMLETRIRRAGVMSEWKAFATLAVEYLGMPVETVPLYNDNEQHNRKLKWKAEKILEFILETGIFGHNRDMSYYQNRPFFVRKAISLWRYTCDSERHFLIFPLDSLKVWGERIVESIKVASAGK